MKGDSIVNLSKEKEKNSLHQSSFELLCHFADRNETTEGGICMTIVDSDRLRYIHSNGYDTNLMHILPLNCTPKNNMLIARKRLCDNNLI